MQSLAVFLLHPFSTGILSFIFMTLFNRLSCQLSADTMIRSGHYFASSKQIERQSKIR